MVINITLKPRAFSANPNYFLKLVPDLGMAIMLDGDKSVQAALSTYDRVGRKSSFLKGSSEKATCSRKFIICNDDENRKLLHRQDGLHQGIDEVRQLC